MSLKRDPLPLMGKIILWLFLEDEDYYQAIGDFDYQEIFDHMNKGADSPEVQTALAKWHQNLRYFYEPTPAMLLGLGQMYKDSHDFRSKFEQYSPEFPVFLYKAIQLYYRNQEKS